MYSFLLILTISILSFSCNHNYKQGKELYEKNCSSCHQSNGEGLAKLYPPLKQSDYWIQHQDEIACIIRNGINDSITVNGQLYTNPMSGIKKLTEFEIANIINFINHEWYPEIEDISIKNIEASLNNCKNTN